MRKTKIFGIETHAQTKPKRRSGVDYARMVMPLTALDKLPEYEAQVWNGTQHKKINYVTIGKRYHAIYLPYMAHDWGFAAMQVTMKHCGGKVVMDLDDAIWLIKKDNFAYKIFKKGSKQIFNLTQILKHVDHVTTTNLYLKHLIVRETGRKHEDITVLPNYINLKDYKYTFEPRKTDEIVLGHYGSTSHFVDLMNKEFVEGVDMIMREFPQVTFLTVGSFIQDFRYKWGHRYNNAFGHTDVNKWIKTKFPEYMKKVDIFITPLTDDVYNRCKSGIKYLEISSAKKPGAYQDIRQYKNVIDHGNNGYLCSTAKDWYEAIKEMIDIKTRERIGESAYKTVKKDWQIQDNLNKHIDMWNKILDK